MLLTNTKVYQFCDRFTYKDVSTSYKKSSWTRWFIYLFNTVLPCEYCTTMRTSYLLLVSLFNSGCPSPKTKPRENASCHKFITKHFIYCCRIGFCTPSIYNQLCSENMKNSVGTYLHPRRPRVVPQAVGKLCVIKFNIQLKHRMSFL